MIVLWNLCFWCPIVFHPFSMFEDKDRFVCVITIVCCDAYLLFESIYISKCTFSSPFNYINIFFACKYTVWFTCIELYVLYFQLTSQLRICKINSMEKMVCIEQWFLVKLASFMYWKPFLQKKGQSVFFLERKYYLNV